MGTKKAKLARDDAPAAERLQSSIEKSIAGVATNNAAREEKYDARCTMMFEKQGVKIGLLKTNVAAIKRKEDLTLLTADTSSMCAEVKAWHKAQCDFILAEMRKCFKLPALLGRFDVAALLKSYRGSSTPCTIHWFAHVAGQLDKHMSLLTTSPMTGAQNLEKKHVLFHATAVTAQLSHDKNALRVDLTMKRQICRPYYVASAWQVFTD
jgi:hypothetical protein